MAVRTHLSWPWRVSLGVVLIGMIAGMWWWGFDFGQIFGGFNRKEVEQQVMALQSDLSQLRQEATQLRARNSWLTSELAMKEGALGTLSKQIAELQNENAQVKQELGFLQKLISDANKQEGLSIARLDVERTQTDGYHYSLLFVRGGNPKSDFQGSVVLQLTMLPAGSDVATGRIVGLTLPDDQPDTAATLRLDFKYYQRVEGSFRVPAGAVLKSVTARAFEAGQANPRATRTLNLS
jgi:hypothetical protein